MALETVVGSLLGGGGEGEESKGKRPGGGSDCEGYSTERHRGERKGGERGLHPSEVDVRQKFRGAGR